MGLAQQFLAGRSPHRVLVGDEPLDNKFSEAIERARVARMKNEFGLVENAMDEEGALARTQNAYRQQRQANLEAAQYTEALALAAAKADGTDAIVDAIFPDPDAKYKQYYENKKIMDEAKVDKELNDLLTKRTNYEKLKDQVLKAEDYADIESVRTDSLMDSLQSGSTKISTD